MEEPLRAQMIEHLTELRSLLGAGVRSPELNAQVLAHIAELEGLIAAETPDTVGAHQVASGLQQKLLGWEAEHPQLVAIAARVVRALETAGL